MALISVVLSFRNEAPLLPTLISRLTDAMTSTGDTHELIFVNDASTDGSLDLLKTHARGDSRVKVITMSRRFGPAECVLAGLRAASGDAVVIMDADLQDPPEVVPSLVARWKEGVEVVHTIRTARPGEPRGKMMMTRLAYHLIRRMADIDLRVEAGDFKLLGRRAVTELLRLPETDPYLRGLVSWVGFRQEYIPYARAPRPAGQSHFPFFSPNPWRTVLSGLTSFSVTPLLIFLPLAVALLLAGAGVGVWAGVTHASAITWLTALVLALSGLHLLGIGVLGVYLARVYRDGRKRPPYIVDQTIGWPDA